MELEIGAIQEGKVTGITKFGAFVLLPGGKSGLVHISEIANAYVNDVNDYLKVGDAVKVKILSVNEAGKINLSIKQAQPSAPRPAYTPRPAQPAANAPRPAYTTRPANTYRSAPLHGGEVAPPTGDTSFEDKLKQYMAESESRLSEISRYNDRGRSRRSRRGN